jgi:hypothetical protein
MATTRISRKRLEVVFPPRRPRDDLPAPGPQCLPGAIVHELGPLPAAGTQLATVRNPSTAIAATMSVGPKARATAAHHTIPPARKATIVATRYRITTGRQCGCRHGRPDRRRNGLGTISARDGGSWVELLSSRLSCPRWRVFGWRSALPFSGRTYGRGQTSGTRLAGEGRRRSSARGCRGQGALGKASSRERFSAARTCSAGSG